ncbi:hypothetical protein ASZ90_015013 [hydrocarbon metagenome]|uniref:Archaeal Type IV pilin N-terminal domain-containing protein n=1 Tax=hydrocarbon metagenome TaxID=938273 RepID=A0A0W8F3A3_9ZZZZ
MNDDAISPVVAVMMILVVIVTLFSIWNATYLPDLKQSAEVGHIREVEASFHTIDENIRNMIVLRRTGVMTVTVPLGGGDIVIHQSRSGGNLTLGHPEKVITVENSTVTRETSVIPITYSPVSNFWQNIGYEWRYGIVNVTKGSVSTPRFYGNYSQAKDDWFTGMVNREGQEIFLANIIAAPHLSVSGNGIAQVRMEGQPGIVFIADVGNPINLTVDTSTEYGKKVNESVSSELYGYWNQAEGRYSITDSSVSLYNLTISIR